MKYFFGEKNFNTNRFINESSFYTTLLWVVFFILILPIQSFAQNITPIDTSSSKTQAVPVLSSDSKTDASNEIKNNLVPTGAGNNSIQNNKNEQKDKKSETSSTIDAASRTVILPAGASSIAAGGENGANSDDLSNVRGAGTSMP